MVIFIRKSHPELAILLSIAAGLLILLNVMGYMTEAFSFLKNLTELTAIDGVLFKLILKITVVAYIVEFAASFIKDLNENSLAEKVVLAGKIIILVMSLPIINSLVSLISELVN